MSTPPRAMGAHWKSIRALLAPPSLVLLAGWIAACTPAPPATPTPRWTNFETGAHAKATAPDGPPPYGAGQVASYGADWTTYPPGRGLGDLWVYDVAFDRRGTMWVATWKGLSRFDGSAFETFTVDDGLVDKWVYAIQIDADDALWLGTEGGVNRFDGRRWTTYTHRDGLGADPARLPSRGETERPSPHHTTEYKTITQANPNYVLAIAIDRKGRKWFGTWGAGLSRFDGRRWVTYTTADGLGGNYIHALEIGRAPG